MKKIEYVIFGMITAVLFILFLTGCSSPKPTSEFTQMDGDWSYSSKQFSFDATITDHQIEILLTIDDITALYWAGDFPDNMSDGMTIVSDADTARLDNSIFGSLDDEKIFTFKDGKIHYEFMIFGKTFNIGLKND